MNLELEISERVVRKIRALSILEGDQDPAATENLIISMLEKTVDNRIKMHLSPTDEPAEPIQTGFSLPMRNTNIQLAKKYADKLEQESRRSSRLVDNDVSGMTDGLGDLIEELPEPESDEEAFVPKRGGVSSYDIEHDMDIDDPEHEAKAEAAEFPPDVSADAIFSNMVGLPLPPIDENKPRPRRRRKLDIRGRVSPATEGNLNDLL